MTIKKHIIIALAAIVLMTTGAVASAQTSTTTIGATTTGSVTTPGVPNTGMGGDATTNWLILATSGIVVLAGIGYIATRPRKESR